jgi:hypothetical protein
MTARTRTCLILFGAVAVGGAVVIERHAHGAMGRKVPGGILIGDAAFYDALSHRLLLGSLFERIAADIAAHTPEDARLLEVGCGPGRLSILLARRYGPRRDRPRPQSGHDPACQSQCRALGEGR